MPKPKKQKLKQRPDGRYVCKADGKFFYGASSDEALAKRAEYLQNKKLGRNEQKNISILEYAGKWLSLYRSDVKTHTYNDYALCLERFFEPVKRKTVREITVDDIAICYKELSGLSAHTITRTKSLVKAVFDSAIESGYAEKNPARATTIRPPKGERKAVHKSISKEVREKILSWDDPDRAWWLLMLYCGLRPGEALAINVKKDVDFDKNIVHVRRAFSTAEHGFSEGKNAFAVRDVPMLPVVADALRGIDGYPIPSALDEKGTGYRRVIDKFHEQIDSETTPYDMRHSFCTMCRDAGIDPKVLAEWMGHSDMTMIMKIYDHVTDERREKAKKILLDSLENSL